MFFTKNGVSLQRMPSPFIKDTAPVVSPNTAENRSQPNEQMRREREPYMGRNQP
jgi:hypothetical protein